MARQFNDDKQKIHVEFEGKHFWIDHSHGENEAETNNPQISVQAKKKYLSEVKTNFAYTPEVVADLIKKNAESIKENAKSNKIYGDNSVTHVALMKRIDSNLDKQTQFFQEVRDFMINKK